MSDNNANTFTIPLTREQFERARLKLADQGIWIKGDEGEVEAHHAKVAFSYDGSAVLTLTVEHKPFVVTEAKAESIIRGWFGDVEG